MVSRYADAYSTTEEVCVEDEEVMYSAVPQQAPAHQRHGQSCDRHDRIYLPRESVKDSDYPNPNPRVEEYCGRGVFGCFDEMMNAHGTCQLSIALSATHVSSSLKH